MGVLSIVDALTNKIMARAIAYFDNSAEYCIHFYRVIPKVDKTVEDFMDRLKILLFGDASNYHVTLAAALRELGHEATVISSGSSWMNTRRDIDLSRSAGVTGAVKYVAELLKLLPRLKGYDIVHLINPIFLDLRPGKVKMVFDYLRHNNRHVLLSAIGTDLSYVRACYDGTTFRYSDYFVGDRPSPYMLSSESKGQSNWFLPEMKRYSEYFVSHVEGAVACLYEYYVAYGKMLPKDKLAYGGIPIDTDAIEPNIITETPRRVRFFIGIQRSRTVLKGTDLLLAALKRTCDRFPEECEMRVVENVPYADYVKLMSESHVILDQLYSYTPATNALLGMARGLVAVSGAEPEFYDFIGEHDCKPVVNVSPLVDGDIDDKLAWIVNNRDKLPALSKMSREFVVKHNDSRKVALRHLDFWNKIINSNDA